MDYQLILGQLYNLDVDGILKRWMLDLERQEILYEGHYGVAGEHYAGKATTNKVLHTGLW